MTAVEWLQSRLLYIIQSSQKDDVIRLFEKAKEMERQTEISDEDAKNAALNYFNEENDLLFALITPLQWIQFAKWYREQLKSK